MISRKRLYEIIEKSERTDTPGRIFDMAIIALILLNAVMVIASSFSAFYEKHETVFHVIETFSVIVFSVEILLRIYTSDQKYPGLSRGKAIVRYLFSFMSIVDLCAVLPFYLPLLVRIDLRALRILRLTRILRVLKVKRYSSSLDLVGDVFRKKRSEIFITMFVTILLILLSSSLMYFIENERQPEQFPNIVASFWWAVITLTTVGYGDVYPVTIAGKFISGVIAILGIGLVALPTGIISSGFMEILQKNRDDGEREMTYCPHCGKKL